jgi:hypothetical protein
MLRTLHKLRHFSSMSPRQPLVAIVGSTGTGKSDVNLKDIHARLLLLTTAAS